MGYALNELANLPVDENVHFYIFAINGQFREPLYEMVERNFINIARDIGSNAVLAMGTNPKTFTTSVARKYLGEGNSDASFLAMLPALLITNEHPEQLTKDSMRMIVPLRDAEARFGGWHQFFHLLTKFARGESDEFARRFDDKEDLLDAANKVISLKPGAFGVSINVNELIERWKKGRRAAASNVSR